MEQRLAVEPAFDDVDIRDVEVGLSIAHTDDEGVLAILEDAQLLELFELIKFEVDEIKELFYK